MTNVNITEDTYQVTVTEGVTQVVTVKAPGPQGPAFADGTYGDIAVSGSGAALTVVNNAITSAKIADGAIVNADINASAAIALTKLATGALPTAITVTSANIRDLSIVDADISGSAAISLSKLATGALPTAITVTSANISDLSIVNADINASAAIAGTKISPDFGSQNVATTGTIASDNITIAGATPTLTFTDNDANPDYEIRNHSGYFAIRDATSSVNKIRVNPDGHIDIHAFLECLNSLSVTGNITVTGTVDGVDIQALNTTVGTKLPLAGGTITGDLTVGGDFTVNGTTTTIDTTTLTVEDKNIELGKVSTPTDTTADGGGITLKGATDKTFQWLDATDSWTSSEHIALPDNKILQLGDGQDLKIYHSGAGSFIQNYINDLKIQSSGTLRNLAQFVGIQNQAQTETMAFFQANNSADLYYDNSKKFETTSTGITASGTQHIFTSGTSGDCELIIAADSDNNNENDNPRILFRQDGSLTSNSIGVNHPNGNDDNDLYIANGGFSGDIVFYTGYDSNNQNNYTAATQRLKITTDGNVQIPNDSGKLQLGASQDLQLYHNGTDSLITHNTGSGLLRINVAAGGEVRITKSGPESMARFIPDGAVELYHDNSKKFETTSVGALIGNYTSASVSSYSSKLSLGAEFATNRGIPKLSIYQDSNGNELGFGVSSFQMDVCLFDTQRDFVIYVGSTEKFRFGGNGIFKLPDSNKIVFGTGDDFQFLHDSTNSRIINTTGDLRIESNSLKLLNGSANGGFATETYLKATNGGSVEIYYDNSKKFETTSTGATVTGALNVDGIEISLTNNDAIIDAPTGDEIFLRANGGSDRVFAGRVNSQVELFYDNVEKFRTTSTGISVTGGIVGSADATINGLTVGRGTNDVSTNTAFGTRAVNDSSVSGTNNTGIGYQALQDLTSGTVNTGIGFNALNSNTTGHSNVGVGYNAGFGNATGAHNVAIGTSALDTVANTSQNVAVGSNSLTNNTASNNTAVGYASLLSNTTGANNVAVGSQALYANTTGAANTAVGANALDSNSTGGGNVAVGYSAAQTNSTGNSLTALGRDALYGNTTGADNTAIGRQTLYTNTTGGQNVAVGKAALESSTTASGNTAVGFQSLKTNTSGYQNVSVGAYSLFNQTTGNSNVAVGYLAFNDLTTAFRGVAIGYGAAEKLTTGSYNTALGFYALRLNETGQSNVALGNGALSNGTGSSNTAVGTSAMGSSTSAGTSVAVGQEALMSTLDSQYNVAIGYRTARTGDMDNGNVMIGAFAGSVNTSSGLVAIGYEAATANTSGIYNTAIGYQALEDNTTGQNNSALGYRALQKNTTGGKNTAFGTQSLDANSTGSNNVGIGNGSLGANTTASNNTAVGYNSLEKNTTGTANVAVGSQAADSCTTGANNVAVGYNAFSTSTVGHSNVAIGAQSLTNYTNNHNTAVGAHSLQLATNGHNNVAVGSLALQYTTSGVFSAAVGRSAMGANTTGGYSVAVGYFALAASQTSNFSVAVGYLALRNATGGYNTAIGSAALTTNTTGIKNVAVGDFALDANTTADNNTAVGYDSLGANTTGANNTAVGEQSLGANTTGGNNVAFGNNSLGANQTGLRNTALGDQALANNTTSNNTAIGSTAARDTTSGERNVAIGEAAFRVNTTGSYNVAIGQAALIANTTAINNKGVGYQALASNTTGNSNTAIGKDSLLSNTTGGQNTVLGSRTGDNITTGFNNIVIGYNAEASSATVDNEITLGNNSIATLRCNVQTISSLSDARDKTNVIDLPEGLDFVTKLRPVKFEWATRDGNGKDGSFEHGFIAQDLQAAQKENDADYLNMVMDENPDRLEASYGKLVPILVKAIQELTMEVNKLKSNG